MTAARPKIPIGMVEALDRAGLSHHEVLARAGLPSRLVDTPGPRVAIAEYFALWRAIAAVSGDPDIGLTLAQLVEADVTEPFFLAVLSAVDVASALDIMSRYKRSLCPEDLGIAVDDAAGLLVVTYDWGEHDHEVPQALVDAELAFLVAMCRRGTRCDDLDPRAVQLRAGALGPGAGHAGFFRCPIELGAPGNRVVFDAADLSRRFVTHNPELLAVLVPYLEATTPPSPRSAIARVRSVIRERLAGQRPTVPSVAKELAMSGRALQRLLAEHDTSFRALLDQVRSESARAYLHATSLSDAEIAFLIGFEDPHSFYRAFRGWTGMSPSAFREQPRGARA